MSDWEPSEALAGACWKALMAEDYAFDNGKETHDPIAAVLQAAVASGELVPRDSLIESTSNNGCNLPEDHENCCLDYGDYYRIVTDTPAEKESEDE